MACHHHQPKGRPPVARDAVDDIPASFLDMTFNHLRTIKIYDIAGAGAEMQLIKGFHPTPSLREEAAKHIWNYIGRAVEQSNTSFASESCMPQKQATPEDR
ncbi:hypothetical protein HAX54_038985 [Datura stramonium]|uniref:Uncharacterized protein n=1 Tax=Datura stramonium TaxID=4076 RepID=A0ABS8SIU7_DATST|nr:hypothetical protein [Datura stramonium]